MLIAAIVGLDTRSTMDLDTTLRNLPLTEEKITEAVETILRRGVFTTRPRDYYDVYILGTTQEYDKEIYKEALKATAEHRGSIEQISDVDGILKQISESDDLKDMWRKYQKKFAYASDISYEDVLEVLRKIVL